uniref:Uncharacterized protein n=1 Tax=Arundo donax TaxID=35708 RepID=A0A0A9E279_ARUDO
METYDISSFIRVMLKLNMMNLFYAIFMCTELKKVTRSSTSSTI